MASPDELKPRAPEPVKPAMVINVVGADLALRFLLFATTLVSLVLMVTSKQTKLVHVPAPFPLYVVTHAKFNHSPALIYFVVAISVALLHSVLTGLISALPICKPAPEAKKLLVLAFLDSLILGVVASAMGAVASIAYIGFKGNSHVRWNKICNIYDKFCRYAGSSVIISLVASIILVLLVMISTYSLYRRSK
ncbi:CASP-like protein 1D1 [Elaeis guineensis]|uniref:CASP-like protein n=1 Tax=Elaeis guineensis var. tenera TaxID=51953 RepID=A0A6I9Q8S1_ELAGV|nr:CASP-like protein 1D1 [Elaeis guineensis]